MCGTGHSVRGWVWPGAESPFSHARCNEADTNAGQTLRRHSILVGHSVSKPHYSNSAVVVLCASRHPHQRIRHKSPVALPCSLLAIARDKIRGSMPRVTQYRQRVGGAKRMPLATCIAFNRSTW